jgi:RNA polymerase sigma factor (sigma-70 family)
MQILDEQKLIAKILAGDIGAYRYLVDKYKKMVYSITQRILKNNEDAEDVAQESFLKVYQKLNSFEGNAKYSTWLYTITYRLCLNKLKSGRKYQEIDDSFYDKIVENTSNADVILSEREQKIYIKNAIDKLPEMDALLIMLYYYDDNSIGEIEKITELSASNIKIKLFRARKFLETELKFLK